MTASHRPRQVADLGIVDGLVQLSFLVQGILGRVADAHDLTLQQTRLLGVLRDRELGMAQLSGVLDLDKSSTTGLVTRAERRGLVRRTAVPEDLRAVRVVLTAQGKRLAEEFAADVALRLNEAAADLTETNRARLSRLASQVVHHHADRQGIDLTAGTSASSRARH
ncbi:MarR family transcriptional regulator [Kutzneria viridogrisea]|uniref:DNA-binding MarR family transcriptional regulator n=1 Tax=Kutzneria viridogrisea TaxID=47990 RepID=A0ABR6BBF1_9PSEU|nr:DNA-binding MarR family transcriptional regulator [Kutzneria viridogrisea]